MRVKGPERQATTGMYLHSKLYSLCWKMYSLHRWDRQKTEGSWSDVQGRRPVVGFPCLEFWSSSSVFGRQFSFPFEPLFPISPQPSILIFFFFLNTHVLLLEIQSSATRYILCSSWFCCIVFWMFTIILLLPISASLGPMWASFSEERWHFGTTFPSESSLPHLKWCLTNAAAFVYLKTTGCIL